MLGMKFRRNDMRPNSAAILTEQASSVMVTRAPVTKEMIVFSCATRALQYQRDAHKIDSRVEYRGARAEGRREED
jgi:hypothetical protein